MKRIIRWIQRKLGIIGLQTVVGKHEGKLERLESLVDIGIDLHLKSESWAVVCVGGKEHRDYVRFFRLPSNEIFYIRDLLMKLEQEYHTRAKIDCPLGIKEYLKW